MRLPTVCSRHVLANADADWLCPITFIPVSLFLIYAVADCVLPTCRVWCGCWFMHPSAFFPSMTFFLAISARSCAPFQFFTLQDLVRGECDVWFFYEHDLAFVPFSFFHPLHVGEQSVEYPQWVISIQRTKANCHVFPFSSIHPIYLRS